MPSYILAGADHQANLDLHGWGFSKFRRLQIAAFFPAINWFSNLQREWSCDTLSETQEDKPSNI